VSKDTTQRIWRTVVFSGAMLGAPLVVADTAKAKPVPTSTRQAKPMVTPLAAAAAAYDAANKRITEATAALKAARSDVERDQAKARLASARKDRTAADARIAALNQPADVVRLAKQLADLDSQLATANADIDSAQTDVDRKRAVAKRDSVRKSHASVETKLKAAQAKKRPRTVESDRPLGRGFILS